MAHELKDLRSAVARDPVALVDAWVDAVVRRCWQLQSAPARVAQVRERCAAIIDSLGLVLEGQPSLELGAPEWREPLHLLSFTAGWMAGAELPISAVVALCQGLRDAVGGQNANTTLYDGLLLATSEAYVAGVRQQNVAQHRSVIARSQVVCLLAEQLPTLFLIGDPDRQAIDDAVARLMTLAVMRQARAVIVDASGLVAPEATLPEALRILADHRKTPPPRVLIATVAEGLAGRLVAMEGPAGLAAFSRLEDAMAAAAGE